MTVYAHRGAHRPATSGHLEALEQERDRLAAETLLYQDLYRQQLHLAELRNRVHQKMGPPPAAEQIRQAAIIRNGDSPETCKQRLNEAEADAAQWTDPRCRKETP